MIDLKNTHCCPLSSTGATCAHFAPMSQLDNMDRFCLAVGRLQGVDGEWSSWISEVKNPVARTEIYQKGAERYDDLCYYMKNKELKSEFF
jgi:hypothetical protein